MRLRRALLFVLLLALAAPARAEEAGQDFADTYYAPMTYQNVALLYWATGILDTADNQAVEGYLRIRECPLYQRFRSDDITWAKIRDDTRAAITAAKPAFPERLAMVMPVTFGPYDPAEQAFALTQDTAIWGMKLFEARASAVAGSLCDPLKRDDSVPSYPPRFVFEISHPFVLTKVPLPQDAARAYLDRVAQALAALPERERTPQRAEALRETYLVLKLRFITAKTEPYDAGGNGAPPAPHLLAVLERYDIYADSNLTQHLHGAVVRRRE